MNKKIIYLHTDKIYPYANNPRFNNHAIDKIAESINKFGFQNPIIIDKNNEIIAGHTRYKAAIQIGIDKVPCIMANELTPDQVKAYRIVDNKTAEFATWDLELLEQELHDLDDMEFDMEWLSFEDDKQALDLDDIENDDNESKLNICKCPKCGFEFEGD